MGRVETTNCRLSSEEMHAKASAPSKVKSGALKLRRKTMLSKHWVGFWVFIAFQAAIVAAMFFINLWLGRYQ